MYLGAETCNSFTAELQANVMARLWLLQSGCPDHMNFVLLYDNKSAADAVIGKAVSKTNSLMCRVGIITKSTVLLFTASIVMIFTHEVN